jgi:ABC-type nitrate/sulfonate/bicarbonate transport system permease component
VTRVRSYALPVVGYAILILGWWLVAAARSGPSSPLLNPAQLLQSTWNNRSALYTHLNATAWEAFLGFAVGAAIALLLSVLTVRFMLLGRIIQKFALVLYSLPLIAIAPLMVIWFGAGLRTKVIIAALAAFFPVLVNTTEALLATSRQALELMQVMGASFTTTSWRVRLPYALPAMFASFTIAAPAAVIGATVAEWVGGDRGLGVAILAAMQSYNVPLLWSSILVVSLLSLVAYGVFAVLGRVLFPWHESVSNAGES